MRCSTCGEQLEAGDRRCPTCGTAMRSRERGEVLAVRRCPRCGYRGEGVGYFRRAGHMALILLAGLFTYGLGALVYWLARKNHRVCPSCGLGWEHARRPGLPEAEERPAGDGDGAPAGEDLPSDGRKRRVLGILLILGAALLISVGIVEMEAAAIAIGGILGVTGSAGFWWGWKAQQDRRDALMARLQRRVLLLAGRKGGTLTVTEVAADLDLSLEAAEKVLISMDDGFRVRSEITSEGLLLYEFPEIQHRLRLERGEDDVPA